VIHERPTIFLTSTYLHEDDRLVIWQSVDRYILVLRKAERLMSRDRYKYFSSHADGSRRERNRRVRRSFKVGSLQREDGSLIRPERP
jgi:hypothetical protein